MWIVYGALMVIGLVGIIVCQKKQKTNPNAQGLAFVFLILILAGAGGMLYDQFGGGEEKAMIASQIQFNKAASKAIADYAGKTWAGRKAVIIANPKWEENDITKAQVASMQEFLKAAGIEVTATEVIQIPESTPEKPIMPEQAVTSKLFNDIFNRYKDAGIYVILSQMPMEGKELAKMKCWNFDAKKQVVVVATSGNMNLRGLILNGKIGATIIEKDLKPEDWEKPAPKDLKAAFDARYDLVTSQNAKTFSNRLR